MISATLFSTMYMMQLGDAVHQEGGRADDKINLGHGRNAAGYLNIQIPLPSSPGSIPLSWLGRTVKTGSLTGRVGVNRR